MSQRRSKNKRKRGVFDEQQDATAITEAEFNQDNISESLTSNSFVRVDQKESSPRKSRRIIPGFLSSKTESSIVILDESEEEEQVDSDDNLQETNNTNIVSEENEEQENNNDSNEEVESPEYNNNDENDEEQDDTNNISNNEEGEARIQYSRETVIEGRYYKSEREIIEDYRREFPDEDTSYIDDPSLPLEHGPRVRKAREPWSGLEKRGLEIGLYYARDSRWQEIKNMYYRILIRRSAVQIKDRARNELNRRKKEELDLGPFKWIDR
ncbi:hypothetical protein K501DRAFT_338832 [Backusella circina FSU 941]|nr:hypothetical protein K501DRAFT_338832 [Backusella circina FSU 941]